MSLIPIFKPFLEDDIKDRITLHGRKQESLGKAIKSTTISDVQLLSWADSNKVKTLQHELTRIEIIYEKHTGRGKMKNYSKEDYSMQSSSIPGQNQALSIIREQILRNRGGVARVLPLFMRDHFKLDPIFFCSLDIVTESVQRMWDFEKRIFFTEDKRLENERLNTMK